ncbi:nuclear pore complex protein NUP160, partial [Tanacetum coccineum]
KQLFKSSEHDADNLFRLAHSLYPSAKEQIATHVMRRLYLPGIHPGLAPVLRCTRVLSQQLGNGAADFIYESFFSEPSPEDIVGRLVKVLETGYTSSGRGLHVSDLSVDSAWEDKRRDHNTHRRFSMKTLLSLCGLCQKAKTWGNIITVIKLYLDFLVAQKIDHNSDSEAGFDVRTCITVQVTSQVAKVTFDSAVDILLLLKYMVKLGGQIAAATEDHGTGS